MKIIDSHVHIYPDKIAERASQSISDFYDIPVKYDGTINKLLDICKRSGVINCVACSVATEPEKVPAINDFMAKCAEESNGFFACLAALHPDMSELEIEAELARAETLKLRGIKLHPDIQRFKIDSPAVFKIYERAEGRFPILFHTGDKRYNFSNPERLANVLREFPRLTAVGAHFGGWSEWGDCGCLEGFENLYVDTSSSLYELEPARANELINMFGEERVMFGTDYPMWDADDELVFLKKLNLSERAEELIFYENAKRLYNL
ncbi:MAG: amidohydrolase family protein [Oscillospiraceae bacterium]|jgi:predicted TIM-barrel fold metal-dependent hydrolase|nr:amidohydrolase family protein [Oscillospiraceae bacterium]